MSSIEERRRLVRNEGRAVGTLIDCFERSRIGYNENERLVTEPFALQTFGQLIAEVLGKVSAA